MMMRNEKKEKKLSLTGPVTWQEDGQIMYLDCQSTKITVIRMDGDCLDRRSSFVSHKVTITFISQVHGPWVLLICQLNKKK